MNLPSASQLQRAEACPGSEALPHAERIRPAAERGTGIHSFLEAVPKIGRDKALAQIDDEDLRNLCSEIDLDRLPVESDAYAQEIAFAYDVVTDKARELGRGLKRHYGVLGENEIPGACDVAALEAGDGVYIGDYKSGFGYEKNAQPIEKNRQLRFLAKAASVAWNRSAATIEIIRIGGDGRPWKKSHGLGPFDLEREADDLRGIVAKVKAERINVAKGRFPTLVSGPHCTYCPAFANCPEQTSLVKALGTSLAGEEQKLAAMLTPETARLALERLSLVDQAADRMREALRIYATENPILLGNGLVYGPVESTRREIDGVKARAVLAKFLGDDKAAAALPVKTSQEAIKDLVTPSVKASGAKVAPILRSLMEEIELAGGVTLKRAIEVKAHKPRGISP